MPAVTKMHCKTNLFCYALKRMGKRILILDDEIELAESVQIFLSLHGFEVQVCASAKLATQLCVQERFDLIISDVMMPDIDGVDFYLEIKEKLKADKTAFIFMTGNSQSMSMHNAYDLGVDEFVLKPFDLTDLKIVVDLVLRQVDPAVAEMKFYRVLLEDYIQTSANRFDIFLLIDSNYMCLAKKGQELSDARLQNYLKKGLKHIFLTADDYSKYIDMQLAISTLVATKPMEQAKKVKLHAHLTRTISTSAYSSHLDAAIFKKALSSFENYSQISFENEDVYGVFESMSRESLDLAVRGAQISFLSTAVAIHWRWTNPKILSKVAVGALLCDVGLSTMPELFLKNRVHFTEAEVLKYEQHPALSFQILSTIKDIPEEIFLVVMQHHENESGNGFPNQLAKEQQHPYSRLVHGVVEFFEFKASMNSKKEIKEHLDTLLELRSKQMSLQVLKTLYLLFNFPIPDDLQHVLLPYESARIY